MHKSLKFKFLILLMLMVATTALFVATKNRSVKPVKTVVEPIAVNVEGTIFSGIKDEPVHMELLFDKHMLVEYDNTVYNRKLAKASAILCGDSYFKPKDLERGTQNRVLYEGENVEEYEITSLLKRLGFDDVEFIITSDVREYETDVEDNATFLMAYSNIDNEYDSFVFVVRGCFTVGEWNSLSDIGYNDESYVMLTGEHDEWKEYDLYKSMDVASNRAMEFIDEFVSEHDDPQRDNVALITGHSRGGSIANIVGRNLEDNILFKSFTYTFNGLGVDVNAKDKEYKTIYNIYDPRDLFVDVYPFKDGSMQRYGTDISVDDADYIDEEYKKITGRDMTPTLSFELLAKYKELFGDYFDSRTSLYEEKTITEQYETLQEAEDRVEQINNLRLPENLALETLCKVSEAQKEGNDYTVTIAYSNGAIARCLTKIFSFGGVGYDNAAALFKGDEKALDLMEFVATNVSMIPGGHQLINDYIVASHE